MVVLVDEVPAQCSDHPQWRTCLDGWTFSSDAPGQHLVRVGLTLSIKLMPTFRLRRPSAHLRQVCASRLTRIASFLARLRSHGPASIKPFFYIHYVVTSRRYPKYSCCARVAEKIGRVLIERVLPQIVPHHVHDPARRQHFPHPLAHSLGAPARTSRDTRRAVV